MYSQNQQRLISRSQHLHSGGSFSSQSVMTAVQDFVLAVNTMNETIMVPCRLLDMDMTNSQNKPVPELLRGETDPHAVYGMLNATKNDLMYGLPTLDEDDIIQSSTSSSRLQDSSSDRWSSPCDSSSSDTVSIVGSSSSTNPASTNTNNTTTFRSNSINNINNNINSGNKTAAVAEKQQPRRRESTLSMVSVASSSGSDCGSGPESDITEESPDGTGDEVDSALGTEDRTAPPASASPASVSQASAHLRGHLMGLYSCLTQLSKTAAYITDRYQEEINE